MNTPFSKFRQRLVESVLAEAVKDFDYPEFTRELANREFENSRKSLGSLATKHASLKKRLADHEAWFVSETVGLDQLGFARVVSMAEDRLPAVLAMLSESRALLAKALSLSSRVSRLFLSVQIILRKPVDGLKTLADKAKQFEDESLLLQEQFESLARKIEDILEDSKKWNQIEKNSLLLHSGYQALGIEGLIQLVYGPDHSRVIRALSLKSLVEWSKTAQNFELEELFESHLNVALAGELSDPEKSKQMLLTVPTESELSDELSALEFFGILNADLLKEPTGQANLLFSVANAVRKLRSSVDSYPAIENLQVAWLNKALGTKGLSGVTITAGESSLLDRVESFEADANPTEGPLVTVIVPVYNSERWLETAIRGLLAQSYQNLEILVLDDASTDGSLAKARELARMDDRVEVFSNSQNQGVYAVRNLGLARARGEFVTVHDADDWSHPSKIALQVMPLIENHELIATTSQAVRINPDSLQVQKTPGGQYLRVNYSSLMFRKADVMERLGFWDEVRFGADSEYLSRILTVFGAESIAHLETGAVSLTRSWEGSLTSGGIDYQLSGSRKTYKESFQRWHAENENQPEQLKLLPGEPRKFYAPRTSLNNPSPIFETSLLFAGDFSTAMRASDLAVFTSASELVPGSKVALVHIPSPENPLSTPSSDFEALCLKNGYLPTWHLIAEFGDRLELRSKYLVSTDNVCAARFDLLPKVKAEKKVLASTSSDAGGAGDLTRIIANFEAMFGPVNSIAASSAFSAKKIARELNAQVEVNHQLEKLIILKSEPIHPEGSQAASLG